MRLALIPMTLLATAALAAPAAAATPALAGTRLSVSTPGAAASIPLAAKVETCSTAASARFAVFKGTMPAIGAAGRMEMRFELYQNTAAAPGWAHVNVDTFDEWDLSDTGVSGFIVKKRVSNLAPATLYRAVVRYRWRDANNTIVRRAKRVTAPCVQPDKRPDLVARALGATGVRRDGTTLTYVALVANKGNGPAGAFNIVFTINGVVGAPQRIGGLARGQRATVSFVAPRCTPGSVIQVSVDSSAEVAESNEANNVLQRQCPVAG